MSRFIDYRELYAQLQTSSHFHKSLEIHPTLTKPCFTRTTLLENLSRNNMLLHTIEALLPPLTE